MTDQEKLEFENECEWKEETEVKENWFKRNLASIILIIFAFLLGLSIMGWQYWKASGETLKTRSELTETNKSLQKEKIKNLIMSAVIEANRGEFDLALVDTSRFFNSLRSEIDKKEDSSYLVEEKSRLKRIFENRDVTIASIARREDKASDELLDIYSFYLKSVGEFRKGNPKKDKTIEVETNTNTNMQDSVNANIDNQNSATNQVLENTNIGNQTVGNTNVQNTNSSIVNTNKTQ